MIMIGGRYCGFATTRQTRLRGQLVNLRMPMASGKGAEAAPGTGTGAEPPLFDALCAVEVVV